MKKKVLAILLAATISVTGGSSISAAEFTSGTEDATEFSESIADNEDATEDIVNIDETAIGTEEIVAEPEKSEDLEEIEEIEEDMGFAAEETEDVISVFDDGQEDGFAAGAERSSVSAKYPSMKKKGNVYTATIKNATEKDYVKFVPKKTGKYVLKMTVTTSYGSTYTTGIFDACNSKFKRLKNNYIGGYSCYKLKKGETYYFGNGAYQATPKVIFQAEMLADVVSIKPVKIDKSIVFYTPIDFDKQYGTDNNKYTVAERWRGKIKVTYSDGETETISTAAQNKYGQWLNRYIVYKGKKSNPEPGTYDVHLNFDNSKAKAVIKNVKVKKLSAMPTLKGSGKKTVNTGSNGMYARFKTGKSTKYKISVSFSSKYDLGGQRIYIEQEKNGVLKDVGSMFNGDTCTLKANTVYYFYVNLHSGWANTPTATIHAIPKN